MESRMVATTVLMTVILMLRILGTHCVTFTPTTGSIAENAATGDTVATFTGSGGGGTFTFTIASNTNFEIASNVLQVKAGSSLNHEAMGTYTLTVTVADSADTTDNAAVTVVVTVTDVNEAPTFSADSYSANVAHAAGAGTSVTSVTATDEDDSTNGVITYSITAGNTGSIFAVDGSTIKVAASKTTNATQQSAFALTVTATDGGGLADTAMLYIGVNMCAGVARIISGVATLVTMALLVVQRYL